MMVLNPDRPRGASRQEGYSIRQDRKCVQQAIETHNRMVFRWAEPRSKTEFGWVSEISNMFDI